jgi:hypothetical protein
MDTIIKTLDDVISEKSCPLCGVCMHNITTEYFSDCVHGNNLCSKSDMALIGILAKLSDSVSQDK